MNTNFIFSCFKWLSNELLPYYLNKELPEELMGKFNVFYNSLRKTIDWDNLTEKDVKRLGFLNLESDDEKVDTNVWFIPLWLLPVIPDGIHVVKEDKTSFIYYGSSAPIEVKYGCLTFGIQLTNENKISKETHHE